MKNYISVGITGGIGSGKSFVCQIIQSMGYPVFYSDDEAKKIIETNKDVIAAVKELFGNSAYQNGHLNRSLIAKKVFQNSTLREKLNNVVHPKVREQFHLWATQSKSKIVFSEAAILFETGAYKQYDFMVLVTAPEELRINRVINRNNFSREMVIERMKAQWPDDKKIPLAHFVINNDENHPLQPQIVKMLEAIQ